MLPLGICLATKQIGYLCPGPPLSWPRGYEPSAGAPRDGDRDLLTGLDAAHQVGSVLAKLAKSHSAHVDEGSTCARGRSGAAR